MKLDYAAAIMHLRVKLNLSQMGLADLLGVSYPFDGKYINILKNK